MKQKVQQIFKVLFFNLFLIWLLLNISGYLLARYHYGILQKRYEQEIVTENIFFEQVFRRVQMYYRPLPQYVAQYDTLSYYWNAPGRYKLDIYDTPYTVQHNSKGLRVQSAAGASAKGKTALTILGDSHAYGLGVSNAQTYAGLLAQEGYPVSLVACSSFGTVREFLKTRALCRAGLIDTPQTLVIHYSLNDSDENAAFVKNNYHYVPKSKASFQENFKKKHYYATFSNVYDQWPVWMSFSLFSRGVANKINALLDKEPLLYYSNPTVTESSAPANTSSKARPFQAVVEHFLADSTFTEVRQVLVLNAMSPRFFSSGERRGVENKLEQSLEYLAGRFPQIEWNTLFIPAEQQDELYFEMDDHTNAAGHRWYAQKIPTALTYPKP